MGSTKERDHNAFVTPPATVIKLKKANVMIAYTKAEGKQRPLRRITVAAVPAFDADLRLLQLIEREVGRARDR